MNLLLKSSFRMAAAATSTSASRYSSWCNSTARSQRSSSVLKSGKYSDAFKIGHHDGNTVTLRKGMANLRSSSLATKAQASDKTSWPRTFTDFVNGAPIVTRKLPVFGKVHIDFGTVMMNFGAITSLSGFCMTDVLLLRGLSVMGSLCGIIYNITRIPKQLNAVAWGFVFISVNMVRIAQLVAERQEIKFSMEEADVFYRFFAPHGVSPVVFQKLLQEAEWTSIPRGGLVVEGGKPLHKVHLLLNGSATAYGSDGDQSADRLYTYSSRENGCIIGATAVVDPTILGRDYPNNVVADEPVRVLSISTEKIRSFLQKNDPHMEAALLHLMYVDLLGSLRRHRQQQRVSDLGPAMQELKHIVITACSNGKVHPQQRRTIREHMEKNNISESQLRMLLQSDELGWTEREWKEGTKRGSQ